jgi:CheY-like chemotaxis protein
MSRVMVVEDDSIILSNLSQLLALAGLDVIEASDGEQAIAYLEEAKKNPKIAPAMVLSDLMMPNVDGFELLKHIRNDAVYERLPFVLLTARSESQDLKQAFDLGANDYLVKPFEVDQLMDLVRRQLSLSDCPVFVDTDNPEASGQTGFMFD